MRSILRKLSMKYMTMPVNVKASFWFLMSAFFQRGVSLITTPIFTRIMSPAEYGTYNVFYSWYGIISILITLNLFYGVYIQGLVKFDDNRNVFTSSMQGLCLTLVLGWFVLYLLFKNVFNNMLSLTTPQMLCMFLTIWANGIFSFWAAEQRVDLQYKRLVSLSAAYVLLAPLLQVILVLHMNDKVMARILGMTIISVLLYFPLFFTQMTKGAVYYSGKYWKYALAFNIPLIPHYLSQMILNSADRLMINSMIGASEAGIYSLAYSISQIMMIFNSSLMQAMEPWLYQRIRDNKVLEISKVAYPSFAIIGAANILLIALAPEVVSIFAPIEYIDTIWVIPPIAMSVFFQFFYTFFAVFEFYYEKTKYIMAATMISAVINIILNYIFIPRYGYYAAGYTTLLCYILYALAHYLFMDKLIKKHHPDSRIYDVRIMLGISLVFIGIGFVLLATYSHMLIRYGLLLLLLAAALIRRKAIMKAIRKIMDTRVNA